MDLVSSTFAHMQFATDERSWNMVNAAVSKHAKSSGIEIWVTVRGYLNVHSNSPLGPCDLEANGMFLGVQVAGWYGAELVVQDMRDIEARFNPQTTYHYGPPQKVRAR